MKSKAVRLLQPPKADEWRFERSVTVALVMAVSACAGDGPYPDEASLVENKLSMRSTCVAPPVGAVAWWSADDTTDELMADNDASPVGAVAFAALDYPGGGSGRAFSLDGVGAYYQSAGVEALSDTFTVELWVLPRRAIDLRPEGATGEEGNRGDQAYALPPVYFAEPEAGVGLSVGTNGIQVFEHSATFVPVVLSYSASLSTSVATHLAVVLTDGQAALYVNGALARLGVKTGRIVRPPGRFLGGRPDPTEWGPFSGLMDELTIYDRALSPAEIAAVYEAGSLGKCRPLHLPWTAGESWSVVSGPHGQGVPRELAALDFSPAAGCDQQVAGQFWVRAAAAGIVDDIQGPAITIKHPDGTRTTYCHVAAESMAALNLTANPGTRVEQGQRLGNPSCEPCPGERIRPSGMHVHFFHSDTTGRLPADGLSISGWTVNQEDPCRRNNGRVECAARLNKPGLPGRNVCPVSGVIVRGTAASCTAGRADLLSDNDADMSP